MNSSGAFKLKQFETYSNILTLFYDSTDIEINIGWFYDPLNYYSFLS